MVSSSSTKKAAKLAQKGKGKKVRFQGGTLFPMIVLAILVVGLGVIVYARATVPAADASPPTADDHWHVAYGFDLCDSEEMVKLDGALEEVDSNGVPINTDFLRTGVHSHDDGVIHWHASTTAATGKNATLGVFLDNYGVELDDDSLRFPDNQNGGKEYVEGETKCPDGEDGELSVTVWQSPEDTSDGRRYVSGFDDIRIDKNSLVFTIAFQPRGTDIGMPPWAADLETLGAIDQGLEPPDSVPGSTVPGSSTTTGSTPDGTGAPTSTVGADDVRAEHDHRPDDHGRLMHAVVLVGGFGTRLRPLTNTVPKSMLPVAHVPLIVRLIEQLERGGVEAVTLALGFLPEPFVAAFPNGRCGGVALDYAIEPEPLDTGGAIRFAADHAGIDDTFVVANGDVLTDLAVADLVGVHQAAGAEATIHLIPVDDPSAFGVVDLDGAGRILAFVEKPPRGSEPSNLINAGTYVFEPSVLERIPTDRRVSIERDTFPLLAEAGRFHAMATDDYWIDAGRPELYLRANLDLVNGRRSEVVKAVAADADVHPAAVVDSSVVGSHARVGAGATITGSVVLPHAVIGGGAQVEASVVAGVVGRESRIVRSVVGADAMIPDGEHVVDARIPEPPD